MFIGIIIHSQTGNTKLVAQKLKDKFVSLGYKVELIKLKVRGEVKPGIKKYEFKEIPDINKYDLIILGSPVEGFALSPVMKNFLDHITTFEGKKTGLLITHFFPFAWMGGKQAEKYFTNACLSKNANIYHSHIIDWSNFNKQKQIDDCIYNLCSNITR